MAEITGFPINTKTFEDLDVITDAQATDADGVMFFDESVGVMKRMTRGELFKNKVIPLDSIAVFPTLDVSGLSDRQQFHLNSFAPDGESGGGPLLWSPDQPKSLHDGVRYFSPTVPLPADFDNPTDVQNYRDGMGEEFPTADGVFVLTLFSIQSSEFPAIDNALVQFDGTSGNTVKNGPVPSVIGAALIQSPNITEVSYHRLNADETVTARTTAEHKTDLSINNVDNTSDLSKPISTATQEALDLKANIDDVDDALALKAPLESPALTGNPTAPTPPANDNDTSIATTAYVQGELTDRIQSVATIADLRALTGLTDGQVIYVREYEAGFKDGGGEFVADASLATADNGGTVIVTADSVRCSRRSDIYRAESWGAHFSRENNAPYFQAAADAVGQVDGRRGVIYKFTDQVSITNNFEFNGNKCQVEFGDGHLNLFNLLAPVDFVRIRGVSNTIIMGIVSGEPCYKNFYSSYTNTGTVIGFPTGTGHRATQTVIENCVIQEARIFSYGVVSEGTTLDCINVQSSSDEYVVRPCSILSGGHDATVLDRLRMASNIYEDIIKCNSGRNFTLRDSLLKKLNEDGLTPLGEIDIYEGVEGAEIYGNKFYNCQVHRKQSGGAGSTVDAARDGIHDNRFYLSGFAGSSATVIPLYWRGAFGNIHDNQFFMRADPAFTGNVYSILADDEVDVVEPFDQLGPTALKIHHNTFDFIGCGGVDLFAMSLSSLNAPNDFLRDILGNTVYGATRFVNGVASIFAGNSWHDPAVGAAQINARIAYGNDVPAELLVVGKADNSLRQFVVPSAGVIDATYAEYARVTDGVAITSITGGRQGQTFIIYARNAVTVTHSVNLKCNGSVNASMPVRSYMTFIKVPAADGQWEELSRSF